MCKGAVLRASELELDSTGEQEQLLSSWTGSSRTVMIHEPRCISWCRSTKDQQLRPAALQRKLNPAAAISVSQSPAEASDHRECWNVNQMVNWEPHPAPHAKDVFIHSIFNKGGAPRHSGDVLPPVGWKCRRSVRHEASSISRCRVEQGGSNLQSVACSCVLRWFKAIYIYIYIL